MKKSDILMQLIGKRVKITFVDDCGGDEIEGVLGYTKKFSAAYGWRKPHRFTINNIDFKASYVRKVEVL